MGVNTVTPGCLICPTRCSPRHGKRPVLGTPCSSDHGNRFDSWEVVRETSGLLFLSADSEQAQDYDEDSLSAPVKVFAPLGFPFPVT